MSEEVGGAPAKMSEIDEKFSVVPSENAKTITIVHDGVIIFQRKMPYREVFLTLATTLLVIVVFALIIAVSVHHTNTRTEYVTVKPVAACGSPHCYRYATRLSMNLNRSVAPCKDFYKYACGSYPTNHPLEPDDADMTVFRELARRNHDKMWAVLDRPPVRRVGWAAERKIKDFYISCVNSHDKMLKGGRPFIEKVIKKIGGSYLLGKTNFSHWDFEGAFHRTHIEYWTPALFDFRIIPHPWSRKQRIIELFPGGFTLKWYNYIYWFGFARRTTYRKLVRSIVSLLIRDSGVKLNETLRTKRINMFVGDVMWMEEMLAQSYMHAYDWKLQRVKLSQMQKTFQEIHWTKFIRDIFDDATLEINDDYVVAVKYLDYFKKLDKIISSIRDTGSHRGNQTMNRVLNNYLVWRAAQNYARYLSPEYRHSYRVFMGYKHRHRSDNTYKDCFHSASNMMPDAMGSLFVRDHFVDDSKQKIHEMVGYLKKELKIEISSLSWMDKLTKDAAFRKLDVMIDKLGYPDHAMDDVKLDAIYMHFKVDKDDYFGNILSYNDHVRWLWLKRLAEGRNRDDWIVRTYSAHAAMYNDLNELLVPAGILQFPLFDKDLPAYVNYGAIGALLAHELINAVDEYGSLYDENGVWNDWWTINTTKNYYKEKKCILDYYDNVTDTNNQDPEKININMHGGFRHNSGRFAIAESGGIRIALRAYKQFEKEKGKEDKLPEFKLTPYQSFFLAYSQSNCFIRRRWYSDERARRHWVLEEDTMNNGALAHLQEFTDVFECADGNGMNLQPKCFVF